MAGIKEEYDLWVGKMSEVEADIKRVERSLSDFSSEPYCRKRRRLSDLEDMYNAMIPYKEALEKIMKKDGLCGK